MTKKETLLKVEKIDEVKNVTVNCQYSEMLGIITHIVTTLVDEHGTDLAEIIGLVCMGVAENNFNKRASSEEKN